MGYILKQQAKNETKWYKRQMILIYLDAKRRNDIKMVKAARRDILNGKIPIGFVKMGPFHQIPIFHGESAVSYQNIVDYSDVHNYDLVMDSWKKLGWCELSWNSS